MRVLCPRHAELVAISDTEFLSFMVEAVEHAWAKPLGYERLRQTLAPDRWPIEALDRLARGLQVSWRVARIWLLETQSLCSEAIDEEERSELATRLNTICWAWMPEALMERDGDLEEAAEDGLIRVVSVG
jgi:hypothetical protein